MSNKIPGDAVYAAAVAMAQVETGPDGKTEPNDIDFLLARIALEAASPVLLQDMRPMTLVEIAARDRPEIMEKAREKVRAERRESQAERIRQAQEIAWAKGATSAGMNLMTLQAAGINPNPYSKEPKHSMHAEGEWFYACEACSGLPDGDRQ